MCTYVSVADADATTKATNDPGATVMVHGATFSVIQLAEGRVG